MATYSVYMYAATKDSSRKLREVADVINFTLMGFLAESSRREIDQDVLSNEISYENFLSNLGITSDATSVHWSSSEKILILSTEGGAIRAQVLDISQGIITRIPLILATDPDRIGGLIATTLAINSLGEEDRRRAQRQIARYVNRKPNPCQLEISYTPISLGETITPKAPYNIKLGVSCPLTIEGTWSFFPSVQILSSPETGQVSVEGGFSVRKSSADFRWIVPFIGLGAHVRGISSLGEWELVYGINAAVGVSLYFNRDFGIVVTVSPSTSIIPAKSMSLTGDIDVSGGIVLGL
jgi:hypothetical protein